MVRYQALFNLVPASGTNTSRSGSVATPFGSSGYAWLRVKYVNASGSGTISAHLHGQTITLEWTGTVTGVFTIQVSNRTNPDSASDTGWNTLALDVAIAQPAGSAGGDNVDMRI